MNAHPLDRRQRLILKNKQNEKKLKAKPKEGARKARLNELKQRETDAELILWEKGSSESLA